MTIPHALAAAPIRAGRDHRLPRWSGAVLCALALASAADAYAAAGPRPVALVVVDVHAVALGYRVSQMLNRPVRNDRNEEIGRIDDLVIQRDRALIAILSVGGFLGIGDRKVAVPYRSLTVSPDRIVLPGASKEALTKLPAFQYAR